MKFVFSRFRRFLVKTKTFLDFFNIFHFSWKIFLNWCNLDFLIIVLSSNALHYWNCSIESLIFIYLFHRNYRCIVLRSILFLVNNFQVLRLEIGSYFSSTPFDLGLIFQVILWWIFCYSSKAIKFENFHLLKFCLVCEEKHFFSIKKWEHLSSGYCNFILIRKKYNYRCSFGSIVGT